MSDCNGCDSAKTLAATITKAMGYTCNGLVGIAALYDVAASNSVGADNVLFTRRAKQLRRLARTLANNVVVPSDTESEE
jgi:hypothetical protein